MNQGFPLGPTELTGPATLNREILMVQAMTALTLTNIIFMHPATPASSGAVNTCTLPALSSINNIKSCIISVGTAFIVYRK